MPEYSNLTREGNVEGRAHLVNDIVEEWLALFGNTAKDGNKGTLRKVRGWTYQRISVLIHLDHSRVVVCGICNGSDVAPDEG